MILSKETCERLNELLKDKSIDIPDFRRTVSHTGNNVEWLRKRIQTRNKNLNHEIKSILGLT